MTCVTSYYKAMLWSIAFRCKYLTLRLQYKLQYVNKLIMAHENTCDRRNYLLLIEATTIPLVLV